jgi:hypothetical protein
VAGVAGLTDAERVFIRVLDKHFADAPRLVAWRLPVWL